MTDHPLRITPESRMEKLAMIDAEIDQNDEVPVPKPDDKHFYITPQRTNLFLALSKAQGEIDAASKTKENEFFTSKYSDIHDISKAIRIPLANADLFFSQMWVRGSQKNEVRVITIVGHKSGEYMQMESAMICKDYENPQKMGSVITYTKRYQLAGMLGVTSTEKVLDDDANIATELSASDPTVIEELTNAAKKGQKSLTSTWKKLPVSSRKGIRTADLSTLKKMAKENETGNTRVASSPTKNTNGK